MKKFILSLLALAFAAVIGVSAADPRTNNVLVLVEAAVGPFPSSPSYPTYSGSFVSAKRSNVTPNSPATPTNWVPVGGLLDPRHIMAPREGSATKMTNGVVYQGPEKGNSLWFSVDASSTQRFTPTRMTVQFTSATNTFLGRIDEFNNPLFEYNGASFGEQWNAGGAKTTITSGKWNANPVNRFVFLGSMSQFMHADTQAESNFNVNWMLAFSDFTLNAVWKLWDGDVEIGSGSLTLHTHPPARPSIKIERASGGKSKISSPGFAGTGKLLQSDKFSGGQWILVGNVVGATPVDVSDTDGIRYYKLLVD